MTCKEIKSWAKTWGYSIIKDKDESINGASYYWAKNDNPSITGVSPSLSKVARDIFNHITSNQWVEHQQNFSRKDNLC
jgi:hypothetical protein